MSMDTSTVKEYLKNIFLFFLVLSVFFSNLFYTNALYANEKDIRIVSLAPAVTETLIAVGCADKIVAISDYCVVPESMQNTPRLGIGTFFSQENVLAMNADYVIGIDKGEGGNFAHIPYSFIETTSIDHILNNLLSLSALCGNEEEGKRIYEEYSLFIKEIKEEFKNAPKKKVLFTVAREPSFNNIIHKVTASGNDAYFNEILSLLNAENAIDTNLSYPVLNFEEIVNLQPDVIVEIVAPEIKSMLSIDDWNSMPLHAVKNKKVFITDKGLVPGPRIKKFIEELKEQLK